MQTSTKIWKHIKLGIINIINLTFQQLDYKHESMDIYKPLTVQQLEGYHGVPPPRHHELHEDAGAQLLSMEAAPLRFVGTWHRSAGAVEVTVERR